MLKRYSSALRTWVVMGVGALVLALSAFFVLSNISPDSTFAQDTGTIKYKEYTKGADLTDPADDTGTGAVRLFTSTDPEGAGVSWDVTGPDADDFMISNGVLSFKKPPNYEKPTTRAAYDVNGNGDATDAGEAAGEHNFYQITIRSSEVRADDVTGRALSSETDVVVEVENVNEPGSVELNWLRPQVGVAISATLTDPDGAVTIDGTTNQWTWERSSVSNPNPSVDGHWVDVATQPTDRGANPSVYIPVEGDFSSVTPRLLRAVVTYTDPQSAEGDPAKEAVGASAMAVRRAPAAGENGSPDFNTETRVNNGYVRTVSEATAVGAIVGNRVVATDPDAEDTLTYQLASSSAGTQVADANADVKFFSINKTSGQIMVAKRLDADSVTGRTGIEGDGEGLTAGEYTVYVTAIDPSEVMAFVKVVITATDANDAPKIWDGSDTTNEVAAPSELSVNEQNSDDDTYTPLTGNQYRATDEDAIDDIKWSLGGTDGDLFKHTEDSGVITVQFEDPPNFEAPGDADGDNVYKVTLKATDNDELYAERPITIKVTNVKETGELEFDKVQPYVGQAIMASVSDEDNGVAHITWQWFRADRADGMNNDPLDTDPSDGTDAIAPTAIEGATSATYTPVVADEAKFLKAEATYIDSWSHSDIASTVNFDERVQSSADTARVPTDENDATDTDADDHRVYKVGAVTANAVRVEGDDTTTGPSAKPSFSDASYTRMVAENARVGDYVGAPVTAARAATYSLTPNSGDAANFTIDNHGQIRVRDIDAATDGDQRPDLDYEDKNTYRVTVTATDANDNTDTATVNIALINLNEMPYLTAASREADKTAVRFPEDRTAAVATYQAMEPDGHGISWSVKGTHAALFSISNGALMFKSQPDYENPKGQLSDTDDSTPGQVYLVTVVATETSAVDNGPKKSDELAVVVTVADADDPGTAEMTWLQPEVGTPFSVTASDPDSGDTETESDAVWYRSKTSIPTANPVFTHDGTNWVNTEWDLISDASGGSYTPVSTANANDVGRFLLALVSQGTNTRYMYDISRYVVRADVSDDDNSSPEFDHASTTRSVSESAAAGANVGDPLNQDITSSTLDTGEHLTYQLEAAPAPNGAADLAFFDIDKATGQISLKKKVSAEATDGRTYDDATPENNVTAGEYKVVARATDPSNETTEDRNTDTITVTITATNVNEDPEITAGGLELTVAEADSSKKSTDAGYYNSLRDLTEATGNPGNAYTASDDEGETINWTLSGPDEALFQVSRITEASTDLGHQATNLGDRQIVFKAPPDYEDPKDLGGEAGDNVYHVTIEAYDAAENAGGRDVRIEVTNVDEAGKLTLAPDQPVLMDADDNLGEVMASLMDGDGIMTDPDGVQTITSWSWYWSDSDVPITAVVFAEEDGATRVSSSTGVPPHAGIMHVLTPSAGTGHHAGENTATYTVASDDVGRFLQARVTYRDGASIEDNPATEVDERDTTTDDTNTLANEPADNALISRTKNAVAPTPPDDTTPDGGDQPPAFSSSSIRIEVPENTPSTGYVGLPVTASGTGLTYELTGANTNRFALAPQTGDSNVGEYYNSGLTRATGGGQIAVKPVTHLDHEAENNTFDVQLTAEDSAGLQGTTTVTIVVTDVNEAPSAPIGFAGALLITGPQLKTYNEVIDPAVTNYVVQAYTAQGQDSDSATWSVSGADAEDFTINDGVLAFAAAPDFENPTDSDEDNVYQVTITAMAGANTYNHAVTVTVENVDEPGAVTLEPMMAPQVGEPITATLEDEDGSITGLTWKWQKDDAQGEYTDVATQPVDDPATTNVDESAIYVPVMADEGSHIQAVAMYDDGHAEDKTAMGHTDDPVGAIPSTGSALGDHYDSIANGGNENGQVDVMEMLRAVRDYFAPGSSITVGEMLELIRVYFAS